MHITDKNNPVISWSGFYGSIFIKAASVCTDSLCFALLSIGFGGHWPFLRDCLHSSAQAPEVWNSLFTVKFWLMNWLHSLPRRSVLSCLSSWILRAWTLLFSYFLCTVPENRRASSFSPVLEPDCKLCVVNNPWNQEAIPRGLKMVIGFSELTFVFTTVRFWGAGHDVRANRKIKTHWIILNDVSFGKLDQLRMVKMTNSLNRISVHICLLGSVVQNAGHRIALFSQLGGIEFWKIYKWYGFLRVGGNDARSQILQVPRGTIWAISVLFSGFNADLQLSVDLGNESVVVWRGGVPYEYALCSAWSTARQRPLTCLRANHEYSAAILVLVLLYLQLCTLVFVTLLCNCFTQRSIVLVLSRVSSQEVSKVRVFSSLPVALPSLEYFFLRPNTLPRLCMPIPVEA